MNPTIASSANGFVVALNALDGGKVLNGLCAAEILFQSAERHERIGIPLLGRAVVFIVLQHLHVLFAENFHPFGRKHRTVGRFYFAYGHVESHVLLGGKYDLRPLILAAGDA